MNWEISFILAERGDKTKSKSWVSTREHEACFAQWQCPRALRDAAAGESPAAPEGSAPRDGTSRLPHQNQNRAGTASPALCLRLGRLGRDPCPKVSLTQKAGQEGDNSREDRNTSRPAAALPARSSEAPGISVASPGQGWGRVGRQSIVSACSLSVCHRYSLT